MAVLKGRKKKVSKRAAKKKVVKKKAVKRLRLTLRQQCENTIAGVVRSKDADIALIEKKLKKHESAGWSESKSTQLWVLKSFYNRVTNSIAQLEAKKPPSSDSVVGEIKKSIENFKYGVRAKGR